MTPWQRALAAIWIAALGLLWPMADWGDSLLFSLIVQIVPALLVAILLLGVGLWLLVRLFRSALRREFATSLATLAILALGAAAPFAGLVLVDNIVIGTLGGPVEEAVEAAAAGRPVPDGVEATPQAAFRPFDTFFFAVTGLAHDRTGQLAAMLPLDPDERAEGFQDIMPESLKCRGAARHLRGPWYRVRLSMEECGS